MTNRRPDFLLGKVQTVTMPFELKNTGATYQSLVNKMFQKKIGASMEVYINDMLVKSVKAELHIAHLAKSF